MLLLVRGSYRIETLAFLFILAFLFLLISAATAFYLHIHIAFWAYLMGIDNSIQTKKKESGAP